MRTPVHVSPAPDSPAHHYDPYDRLAPFYDTMAAVMLLPFGGEGRVRRRGVQALDLQRRHHVLELGCGTGSMTRLLLQEGARVTAVDLAEPMIARAKKKAPNASFLRADILTLDLDEPVDRVLLTFVLHEMSAEIRAATLATARRHLGPEGRLVVLDFAGDAAWPVDLVFRAYLRLAEPEIATDVLGDTLVDEIAAAGFHVEHPRRLTLGTARILVAHPR